MHRIFPIAQPGGLTFITILVLLCSTHAHVVPWHKGMYCLNGTSGRDNPSTNDAVNPLYQLSFQDWWMHHVNGVRVRRLGTGARSLTVPVRLQCDQFPPAPGDFLELPVNGNFTVELAVNRAFTSLSFNGNFVNIFGDGRPHPGLGNTPSGQVPSCITEPNLHTQNRTMAAGSAFAISYTSDITQVTPENLVVFTVQHNTPWELLTTYSVPNLPACPPGGCICAWGWVPNGCGEPNMYMLPYKCRVTGVTGDAAVAPGNPAVWCENDPSQCISGAKQMIYWNQAEGNNIEVIGTDLAGSPKSPAYNMKLGFVNGAQTDIFQEAGSATQTSIVPSSTSPHRPHHAGASKFSLHWALVALLSALANTS